jgi:ABC-2 type transport system ATP-binding protein
MTLLIKNMNMKRGKKRVIRQLNLLVESGEVAALIAPNGFGKTTLLNGIAQLLPTTCPFTTSLLLLIQIIAGLSFF